MGQITTRYHFDGHAGCVTRLVAANGQRVALYVAKQAGFPQGGGPWVTVCETHGERANHPSRIRAAVVLQAGDFCRRCRHATHAVVQDVPERAATPVIYPPAATGVLDSWVRAPVHQRVLRR